MYSLRKGKQGMAIPNTRITLHRYPVGAPLVSDFSIDHVTVPELQDGQFLIENLYLSMDAGFRQWMRQGSSDNYLTEMQLGAPVMSITLGRVHQSRNAAFPAGALVMGRNAWESFSVSDGSDFVVTLPAEVSFPLYYYAGLLGPTGLTAYFGLTDIGRAKAGETVLISAAAGAIGVAAGQIAKNLGCRVVGMTSSREKCDWLTSEVGYDAAISYRSAELDLDIRRICPDGVDVYFDNVGGPILDAAMANMAMYARVVLCGALAAYNEEKPVPGPYNMWNAITKRATLQGFMFSDYTDRYPAAFAQLQGWLEQDCLHSFDTITDGIENTAAAFCGMLTGANRGKAIVRLA